MVESDQGPATKFIVKNEGTAEYHLAAINRVSRTGNTANFPVVGNNCAAADAEVLSAGEKL